ncbi:DUF3311 domain-containing protein [Vallicoccus soli]|uniref:DUF3311 domain-containing protein n=1 Tax=Vallicoccus soli TaxID=2339232 RepID=UPI001C498FB6|nr:DUF3311 domain-containing protein [Vallicoccus soli]
MAAPDPTPPRRRSDTHPLNWLLVVPCALVLVPPLYNRVDPELAGIPFFYWWQMLAIPVGVACTVVVYRAHRGDRR